MGEQGDGDQPGPEARDTPDEVSGQEDKGGGEVMIRHGEALMADQAGLTGLGGNQSGIRHQRGYVHRYYILLAQLSWRRCAGPGPGKPQGREWVAGEFKSTHATPVTPRRRLRVALYRLAGETLKRVCHRHFMYFQLETKAQ
jgi:hypothetical protein